MGYRLEGEPGWSVIAGMVSLRIRTLYPRVQAAGSTCCDASATRIHDVRHAVAHRARPPRRASRDRFGPSGMPPRVHGPVYQHAWQEGPSEAARALEAALGRPRVGYPLAQEPA